MIIACRLPSKNYLCVRMRPFTSVSVTCAFVVRLLCVVCVTRSLSICYLCVLLRSAFVVMPLIRYASVSHALYLRLISVSCSFCKLSMRYSNVVTSVTYTVFESYTLLISSSCVMNVNHALDNWWFWLFFGTNMERITPDSYFLMR